MDNIPSWQWAASPDDTTWRRDWRLWRQGDVGAYSARHASGIAFELYYDSLDEEDIDQGWMAAVDEDSEPIAAKADRDCPGRVSELEQQLITLWRELGFKDDIRSPR